MSNYEEYKTDHYTPGFNTEIESDDFEPGLDENIVRRLSAIKNEPEWVLDFRLKAFEHLQKIRNVMKVGFLHYFVILL